MEWTDGDAPECREETRARSGVGWLGRPVGSVGYNTLISQISMCVCNSITVLYRTVMNKWLIGSYPEHYHLLTLLMHRQALYVQLNFEHAQSQMHTRHPNHDTTRHMRICLGVFTFACLLFGTCSPQNRKQTVVSAIHWSRHRRMCRGNMEQSSSHHWLSFFLPSSANKARL